MVLFITREIPMGYFLRSEEASKKPMRTCVIVADSNQRIVTDKEKRSFGNSAIL